MSHLRAAVLTVSDRSASGERDDVGGPSVAAAASDRGWIVVRRETVPDDAERIAAVLRAWSEGADAADLILTTGGTGLAPRDVTPEATRAVIEKELPGFSERMRREGERNTPLALLSRGVCGARGLTLIVNLPGSPKGALESLAAVAGLIPHAVDILKGAGDPHNPNDRRHGGAPPRQAGDPHGPDDRRDGGAEPRRSAP